MKAASWKPSMGSSSGRAVAFTRWWGERMDVKSAMTRARRGLREERRLYIVAVTSLAVAFLCLGATLLGVTNLDAAATRWGQSGRITLFL